MIGQGIAQARRLLADISAGGRQLPILARETIGELQYRLRTLDERILAYDRTISALAKACEPARRLMAFEGVGPRSPRPPSSPAWAMPEPSRAGDSLLPGWV